MYLVGLGMQVLEWRINTPNNDAKFISKNKYPFQGNNFFSYCLNGKCPETETTEYPLPSYPKIRMTWTGDKVDLVELIYALVEAKCFNHGNVNIKEIVAYIEVVFNIDLGDYYDAFRKLRNRGNRTAFLDSLIKYLKERMDKADRKK